MYYVMNRGDHSERPLGLPVQRLHDLYISDPRRVPPERLKTILRRPVK